MSDLDDAIMLYVGWRRGPFPEEDEIPVLDRFGPADGAILVDRVRSLLAEFQRLEPDWKKHTNTTAAEWAVDQLSIRHPQLSGDAKAALRWIFTWWWK